MEDVEEVIVEEPYGFIYVSTNMCNGKRYVGQKKFNRKWEKYLGSGVYFKKAIEKYGKENFKRDIIDIAYSKEELDQKEIEYIAFFNAVKSTNFYNVQDGGNSGTVLTQESIEKIRQKALGRKLSEETKQKISKSHTGLHKGNKNNFYGVHMYGSDNPFFGHKHTDKTKQKMKENHPDCRGENSNCAHPVYCVELDKYFPTRVEAEKETGARRQHIQKVCDGYRKTAGGYHWKNATMEEYKEHKNKMNDERN